MTGAGTIEKRRLRLWIRMFRTTRSVEARLRKMLSDSFDSTLPRFDVLAALYRAEGGLKMSGLSSQLLVSNGNVTGIVDRLVGDGMVERVTADGDRRASLVRLTAKGRKDFIAMAARHEAMINDVFSDLEEQDLNGLADIFGRLKRKEDDHEQDG